MSHLHTVMSRSSLTSILFSTRERFICTRFNGCQGPYPGLLSCRSELTTFSDSKSAISVAGHEEISLHKKHIDVTHHVVRDTFSC